jgi:hypothetical protein
MPQPPITLADTKLQGVQKVTQSMAYLESVSWMRHFKEFVAYTIPGLKPPRLIFMGGISRILCIKIIHTHTARASGQHSAQCGQDIDWHIAKRVR